METLKECAVCFQSYNTTERAPRVLTCGHSLCSECLARIVQSPYQPKKCPFDQKPFNNSLDSIPFNYALKGFLEQKATNICETHQQKLKWMCFTDQIKICSQCAKEGHQDHRRKKIKEVRACAGKIKMGLEEVYLKTQQFEENEEKSYEEIKKVFVSTIDEEFTKIQNILVKKKIEVVQQANNLFNADRNSPSESLFTLKQQMKETISDIDYACRDDKNLMILDKEFNSDEIIGKSRLLIDKGTQIYQKALGMQKQYQESLNLSKATLNSLQLPSQEFIKEIHSTTQLSEEEIEKLHKSLMAIRFQSFFEVKNTEEGLIISTGGPEAKEVEINIDDSQTTESIAINLRRYDILKNEPDPSLLSYILSGLEKWTSLDLSFVRNGFNNDPMVWVGHLIFGYVQHLKSLYIDLVKCKMNNEPMKTLCDGVLSRVLNLQDLYLHLDSSGLIDSDVDTLVKTIKPFAKSLECFRLHLKNNKFIADSFEKIFQVVQDMERIKDLELDLSQTNLLDEDLELFGNYVLPHLKALESLSLGLNKCKVLDSGVYSVFKKLPHLKTLQLYLCYTKVTEKTGQAFLRLVLPRLKSSLESLTFAAKETKIWQGDLQDIRDFSETLKGEKTNDSDRFDYSDESNDSDGSDGSGDLCEDYYED